jgi:peptidoglycan/LPS O-acetylase OafA/YrhL
MRLPFRADIEGLRAVAILLVVCAHANVPWLEGGFIGVDVFFVLSGYLITGLLVREFEGSGRINLAAFYARRLQRLLPGLLLVVLCTALAAMVLLAPFEQIPQAWAGGAAATWTSNFHFALSKLDYFGPTADTNLFLHTWSLGLEEQFYLLWPALMLFLLGAWRWQGGHRDFPRLQHGMWATVVLCLLLSLLLTYASPQLGFYMVVSRGWQFALGALVFLHFDRNGISAIPPRFAVTIGWIGLVAILASAMIVDSHTPYPGYWAIMPSMGTAIVLYAGTTKAGSRGVGQILAIRPLQDVGQISYAWYLWHWPVLLLGATVLDAHNPWHVAILVLISVALAALSYQLIESPLRRLQALRDRPRATLAGGLVLMAVALMGAFAWNGLAIRWAQGPDQVRFAEVGDDMPIIYGMKCDDWYRSARVLACVFGQRDAPHTAILMGDSIAGQWFPAVAMHFKHPGWRVIVLTKSSCPMVDKPIFYERIGREYIECEQWRNAAIRSLESLRPDIILLSSDPDYAYSAQDWTTGTTRVLDAIAPASNSIGILLPTPVLPFNSAACLARQHWRQRTLKVSKPCEAPSTNARLNRVRAALVAAAKHSGARVLDLSAVICPNGRCDAERDGLIIYRDSRHLTATYTETLAGELGNAIVQAGLEGKHGAGEE